MSKDNIIVYPFIMETNRHSGYKIVHKQLYNNAIFWAYNTILVTMGNIN